MRTYLYFSSKFDRDIKMTFNASGILTSFEVVNGDELTTVSADPMAFPTKEATFLTNTAAKKVKVTELERVVTFVMFWDKYAYKDCGKSKCEASWNKLSKEDQIKAFDYIVVYDRRLKMNGLAKLYATTYLNKKPWEQ